MKEKSKGGKGKTEDLRNKAVILLHRVDPKTFTFYALGKLFERDRKTISGIIESYGHKISVGVIHR